MQDGGARADSLTVAAWIDDMNLVKSLYSGSDQSSLFGRPSWAAAAQGHLDILKFLLSEDALPYEPNYVSGPTFELWKSPLGTAAYVGRDTIVEFYMQLPYCSSQIQPDETLFIYFAAQANQANTLKILLDRYKKITTTQEFLYNVDGVLKSACSRGAADSGRVLLDYRADVNETDSGPYPCLQLAAISGSTPLVKILLEADTSSEAPHMCRKRAYVACLHMGGHKQALREAKRKGFTEIATLIEERKLKPPEYFL